MTRITLEPPIIEAHRAFFSWKVDPPSALYYRTDFELRFPDSIDLRNIAPALWWTVFLACLHSHWPLLRPCLVDLPVRMPVGYAALWERLLEAETNTLEAYGPGSDSLGGVELVESGPALEPLATMADNGRCVTAFSGGKDSLLSAGVLCEFTAHPILVTTTSPMPGKSDHTTARRRQVLAQIAARRDVTFVEVHSDFRSGYDNGFPASLGYRTSINEISDTFLYFASALVVGAVLRAPHLFLASEAEVQENAERGGVIIQHPHFMYSTVTQRALQALIRDAGMRFSSLTSPLHNGQVQQLLWRRYHDLSELQYSCWRVGPDDITCSRCNDCFRLALCALSVGGNPQRMGIDLAKLLIAKANWGPRNFRDRDLASLLPNELLRPENDRQIIQYIQRVPLRRILHLLVGRRASGRLSVRIHEALKSYAQLRRRFARFPTGAPFGYRPGFLRQVDPLLREHVTRLCEKYFEPESDAIYGGVLRRGDALAKWICEPLAHAPGR